MNKKHWITVRPGADIEQALVDDLVTESYLLVVAGLPRQSRPVDPDPFSFLPSAA
jgi:predicted DNA-binding protein (MmcQ/YjbR family)